MYECGAHVLCPEPLELQAETLEVKCPSHALTWTTSSGRSAFGTPNKKPRSVLPAGGAPPPTISSNTRFRNLVELCHNCRKHISGPSIRVKRVAGGVRSEPNAEANKNIFENVACLLPNVGSEGVPPGASCTWQGPSVEKRGWQARRIQ